MRAPDWPSVPIHDYTSSVNDCSNVCRTLWFTQLAVTLSESLLRSVLAAVLVIGFRLLYSESRLEELFVVDVGHGSARRDSSEDYLQQQPTPAQTPAMSQTDEPIARTMRKSLPLFCHKLMTSPDRGTTSVRLQDRTSAVRTLHPQAGAQKSIHQTCH